MSSSRSNLSNGRAYKPPLASERVAARSPLTPRLAANASSTLTSRGATTTTPRVRQTEEADDGGADNITPRSAKRRSRVEGNTTPNLSADSPGIPRAQTVSPLALGGNGMLMDSIARPSVTRSPMSDSAAMRPQAPFVRSPMATEISTTKIEDDLDSRFFHANEMPKVEKTIKPEVKRPAAFFYADGQQEQTSRNMTSPPGGRQDQRSIPSTRTTSPARSAISRHPQPSEQLNSEPLTKSPPMLSPALSTISSASPFFASIAAAKPRSPSPSKDNIHLSYRRGVSQIIGNRPSPIPATRPQDTSERRPSFQRAFNAHRKSPSLSSIDSELTNRSRRRSNTGQDMQGSSPLREEPENIAEATSPIREKPQLNTAIDVADDSAPMSPSKSITEMAADARRERKVLDLEISNSSLLAINSSLEREIRRQKSELKRFRRLSRAGRFSTDLQQDRRGSGSLGTLNENQHDLDDAEIEFGPPSGLSELYNDYSDSDEDSSIGSSETGTGDRKLDRLAKDDQRLRADLERHRELLVQSQMMNQSLRRCLYATEELIKAGKKAVDYKVRVSDVKLGGRILTGHEDEDEFGDSIEDIEVEDDFDDALSPASPMSNDGVQDHAQSFVEIWGGIGKDSRPVESTEAADRDSGIEIDRSIRAADLP